MLATVTLNQRLRNKQKFFLTYFLTGKIDSYVLSQRQQENKFFGDNWGNREKQQIFEGMLT